MKDNYNLIFDIETGTRPEVIANPADWFKPDSRLKDPEKIRADLAESAEKGALSPITGQVLAIGYSDGKSDWAVTTLEQTEKAIIDAALFSFHERLCQGGKIIGFNILEFDLSFLLLRACAIGAYIPASLGQLWRSRWQACDAFIDLMDVSKFGRYDRAGYSLDRVCRSMGISGKTRNGGDFARLLATDPDTAKAYLLNDIRMTRELAAKIIPK